MLSKRWEVMLFLFTGATIAYTLRVNMSICAQKMKDDLGWSESQKGLVLSAFFWGYSFGQIPASLLAEKLGSKTTFGFAILVPCVLTLLVPLAAKTSFSSILAIRALIGLSQAATFPSIYHFYPRWVPKAEKTKMISFSHSGMYFGEIVGFGLSGALINADFYDGEGHYKGWEVVFFVFGLIGILWFPIFWWRVYDTPEEHPYITNEEVALIRAEEVPTDDSDDVKTSLLSPSMGSSDRLADEQVRHRHPSRSSSIAEHLAEGMSAPALEEGGAVVLLHENNIGRADSAAADEGVGVVQKRGFDIGEIPWKEIFTNPVALTLFFNMFTYGWIGYMVLTEMPSYLTDALGFDLESAGFLSIVPYFANFISVMVFGLFFDYLQFERKWTVRDIRQWAQRTAFIGAGGCLLACGFISEPLVAYTFMVLALWCFGAIQSGISCSYLEASPNFSNIMNTIGNMMGAIAGVLVPIIVSIFVTTWEGRFGWQVAFLLTVAMCAVSLVCWKLFITSEIIPALNTPYVRKQ